MREQTKIKLDYLSETKEALKNLLIEKGQTVADTDTFRSYVDKFRTLLEASGNAVVWFVTFIGADGSELFKMPVLNKDDCKDPIAHGDITTPTKESTVSEVFTYSGWSATDGGEADPTILQNITADKTVYAAFTASPRYYTIRFFDGETLHETKQFAYGTMPTIDNPTKDAYLFVEWQPALSVVTGDADYYATWKEKPAFATASWEEISQISQSGRASEVFSLGDERTETLTWANGTTEEITFIVGALEYANMEDGKPAICLMPKNLISKKGKRNTSAISPNDGNDNSSYTSSTIYQFYKDTVIPALPIKLQAVMRNGLFDPNITPWGVDKGYVKMTSLTYYDIGLKGDGTTNNAANASACLYSFSNSNASRIRKTIDGTAQTWWSGNTAYKITTVNAYRSYGLMVKADGSPTYFGALNELNVMFKIFI